MFEALTFGGVLRKALDSDSGIWKTSNFGVSGALFLGVFHGTLERIGIFTFHTLS